ncbi:hypothetical protein KCU85_g9397, partial [Aureobasidium melanogenum]
MDGRKIVISGAGRGLGKALAITVAAQGAVPILLGRSHEALQDTCETIKRGTSISAYAIVCDLANVKSVTHAASQIVETHPDIDILVNNGAHYTSGRFGEQTNDQILATVNSIVTGTMILTRELLPLLRQRPHADIHNIVSMSGLPYARLGGASLPFRAAKAAQDGFSQGLVEELYGSRIRVTSIYPGLIEDVAPSDHDWSRKRDLNEGLTNRDVVDTIVYALSAPPNVSLRSIVIERTRSDFLA